MSLQIQLVTWRMTIRTVKTRRTITLIKKAIHRASLLEHVT